MRGVTRITRKPPPTEPLPSAINTFEDFCMFMSSWIKYIQLKYRWTMAKRGSLITFLGLMFKFGVIAINL